jgi:hypothetical protein
MRRKEGRMEGRKIEKNEGRNVSRLKRISTDEWV